MAEHWLQQNCVKELCQILLRVSPRILSPVAFVIDSESGSIPTFVQRWSF